MRVKRSDKVGGLIRQEISEIILSELKDPRIGFVTITKVTVSDDLRAAKIFYSVFGTEWEKEASTAALKRATGYIKRELGRRVRLKYMPEIIFVFDDTLERAGALDELLHSLKDREKAV